MMWYHTHSHTYIPTSILSHLDNTTKKCRCMHVFWSIRFLLEKVYQLWVISKCKPGSEKYYRTLKVLIRQELKASEPHRATHSKYYGGMKREWVEGDWSLYWGSILIPNRIWVQILPLHYTTLTEVTTHVHGVSAIERGRRMKKWG